MAIAQPGRAVAPDIRRSPVVHAEALQESKRIEKMQTVCASHRTSGTVELPVLPDKAADPR